MRDPYPGLTPEQLAIAKALVKHPRWRGRAGLCALRADGSLVELRTPMPWPEGGVPYLVDPICLGHLMDLLYRDCAGVATVEMGSRPGGRAYCTLRARGGYEKTWEGDLVAEVLGSALLARWEAMGRGSSQTSARCESREIFHHTRRPRAIE